MLIVSPLKYVEFIVFSQALSLTWQAHVLLHSDMISPFINGDSRVYFKFALRSCFPWNIVFPKAALLHIHVHLSNNASILENF